jgi:hypothetical protein
MSLYIKCALCAGNGHSLCEQCVCILCVGEGWVACSCHDGKLHCSSCTAGTLPCPNCAGNGVVLHRVLFFTFRRRCGECSGVGRMMCGQCAGTRCIPCGACQESRRQICPTCRGTPRRSGCSRCDAHGHLVCADCGGRGRFESEWLKSLPSLPVERLRFEFDKRSAEIRKLSREIEGNREALTDIWTPKAIDILVSAITRGERRVAELEEERTAVEQVIHEKWR